MISFSETEFQSRLRRSTPIGKGIHPKRQVVFLAQCIACPLKAIFDHPMDPLRDLERLSLYSSQNSSIDPAKLRITFGQQHQRFLKNYFVIFLHGKWMVIVNVASTSPVRSYVSSTVDTSTRIHQHQNNQSMLRCSLPESVKIFLQSEQWHLLSPKRSQMGFDKVRVLTTYLSGRSFHLRKGSYETCIGWVLVPAL